MKDKKYRITNNLIRSCSPANLIESLRIKNLKLILEKNDDIIPPGPPPEFDGREIEGFSPDSPYNGDPNNGFVDGIGLYDFQQSLDDAGIGGPNGADTGFPDWMQAIIGSYGIPPWLVNFYINIASQYGIPPHILSGYLGWSGSSDAWASHYFNMYIDLSFLGMPGIGYHFSVDRLTGQWSAAPAFIPIQQYSGFWNGTTHRPYAFNYSGGKGRHRVNPDFYNLHDEPKSTLTLPTGSTVYFINNAYYFASADGLVYTIGPNGLEVLSIADAQVLLGSVTSSPIGVIGQPPFIGRDVSLPGGNSATIFNNNPFWLRRPNTYIPGGPGSNLGTNSLRPLRNIPNFRPRF